MDNRVYLASPERNFFAQVSLRERSAQVLRVLREPLRRLCALRSGQETTALPA